MSISVGNLTGKVTSIAYDVRIINNDVITKLVDDQNRNVVAKRVHNKPIAGA